MNKTFLICQTCWSNTDQYHKNPPQILGALDHEGNFRIKRLYRGEGASHGETIISGDRYTVSCGKCGSAVCIERRDDAFYRNGIAWVYRETFVGTFEQGGAYSGTN